MAMHPEFLFSILDVISHGHVYDNDKIKVAAVHFMRQIHSRWAQERLHSSWALGRLPLILDYEKSRIKSRIVECMIESKPRVQIHLCEAIAITAKHDFPRQWASLLPEFKCELYKSGKNYTSINAILGTVNLIFKKFRQCTLDLKYCVRVFADALRYIFFYTSASILRNPNNADSLCLYIETQRLCCRIFYSLNYLELPEFFENHMSDWMQVFQMYLTATYPAFEDTTDGLALVDGLRAAVCKNINLYLWKYGDKLESYLQEFALAVWELLKNASVVSSRAKLTGTLIEFLRTISNSVYHSKFSNPEILQNVLEIVIQTLRFRDDDDLFQMNYDEYVRRDIEDCDDLTLRRIACELLSGIATNYRDRVRKIVSTEIQNMLDSYRANPDENWKEKNCAIYLVVLFATRPAGGALVTSDLVDVENFFATDVVPELEAQDVNGFPVLTADALKFFTTFRNQISKAVAISMMPDVIRFLASKFNVVHSYAANCIEKLLLVKDEGRPRYTSLDINLSVQLLMTNLFNTLNFAGSQENVYIMKCIVRVLGNADIAGPNIGGQVVGACIYSLTDLLKNPKSQLFNYYVFEAVASLIRRPCEMNPLLISVYEKELFPVLTNIMVEDDTETWHYTIQIIAQLVEIHTSILFNYKESFEFLLSPLSWERSKRVTTYVRMLLASFKKVKHELRREDMRLDRMLGIFKELVSYSRTRELGFDVLNTVIENLSYDVISPHISLIWATLFSQTQKNLTQKSIKSIVTFMSLFLVKHGYAKLEGSINATRETIEIIADERDVLLTILEKFWIPNLKLITGSIALKLTSVASTKLICECPSLLDSSANALWGRMLRSIVILLSWPEQERVEDEPEVPDFGEIGGDILYNAAPKEEDPLREVRDPKEIFVTSVANLSAASRGKYPMIIKTYLDDSNQAALFQLCKTYNLSIV